MFRRADAPGARTIEGRIFGDPPWPRAENASLQWISDAVMNNVVNRIALESALDRELPEWSLLGMVEGAANTSLDDGTDAGARTWLEDLVAALRTWLGPHAPPRGAHDLDRER